MAWRSAPPLLVDIRLGWNAWIAAAAHEVPQELGDFGVLLHGGLPRRRALLLNVVSGLAFLVGTLIAFAVPAGWSVVWLIPVAAGNFLYIATVDLSPEVARSRTACPLTEVCGAFAPGVLLMVATLLPGG